MLFLFQRFVTGSGGSEVASKPENMTKNKDANIRPCMRNIYLNHINTLQIRSIT